MVLFQFVQLDGLIKWGISVLFLLPEAYGTKFYRKRKKQEVGLMSTGLLTEHHKQKA